MSLCQLRTPWPIHFKLLIVIGIDSLMVYPFGEISIFHSRVMGLYSSNCRWFFVCRTELRTPWPIHFKLRTVIGIDSLTVCILFFIQELWERKSLQILYECWRRAYHALLAQLFIIFVLVLFLFLVGFILIFGGFFLVFVFCKCSFIYTWTLM